MSHYELNEERNGVEIYFDSFPSDEVRAELKANGWRWAPSKKCWYAKQSDESIELAKRICGEASTASVKPKNVTPH